jgi:hypothetical protein
LTNSSIDVPEKSEIGKTDLKTAWRHSSGRHLRHFVYFSEKLANALATCKCLRHHLYLSFVLAGRNNLSGKPQSIAAIRTGVAARAFHPRDPPCAEPLRLSRRQMRKISLSSILSLEWPA